MQKRFKAKILNFNTKRIYNQYFSVIGKIPDAVLIGKRWYIPEDANKPERLNKHINTPKTLLEILKEQKISHLHGGIYHKIQIDLTYNSNHIEGSKLTHDQTRYIFETNTISGDDIKLKVDDIKMFYYRGLKEWKREPGYLRDTCLSAQDKFKRILDYFRISFQEN